MDGRSQGGWWCRDNEILCQEIWWCDLQGYLLSTFLGMCCWSGLFVLLSISLRPVNAAITKTWPSTVEDENTVSWLVWQLQGTIHAGLVSWMAIGSIWGLSSADPRTQLDVAPAEGLAYRASLGTIANASHIFFCYIVVDTFVTFWRKSMTADYFTHHAVFIFVTLLIQYDCIGGYLAGWLLAMEFSTIFLNGFVYWRFRLGLDHTVVKGFFLVFTVFFCTFRLVGMIYICIYWLNATLQGTVPFHGVPKWHLHVVSAALVAAVAIQLFWAKGIARKLLKVFAGEADKGEKIS